jgi:hypothetical protein
MVTVRIKGRTAKFDAGEWTSRDKDLERFLNSLPMPEVSPSKGRPDLFVVTAVLAQLGEGEIVRVSKDTSPPGLVY